MTGPWEKYQQQASGPWTKYAAATAPTAPEPKADTFQRSTILPLGKDTATGEISLAMPGLLKDILNSAGAAVTAPGRALHGDLQVIGADGNVTPEAIAEGTNFAAWATPASPASGMRMTPAKGVTPKPEGLQAAEAARRVGVELPRIATTESPSLQQFGKGLTNVPVGSTPLKTSARTAINQLDDAARAVQQGFGSGSVERAGSQAREDITKFATETIRDAVSKKYDAVDDLVTQNVLTKLNNTAKVATDISARRANANMTGESKAVSFVRQALDSPNGMNYQGIKDLRTSIGEMLDNPQSLQAAGFSEGELRRIYGALSEDLKSAVSRAGGEKASKAFAEANTFAAVAANERKALDKILGRSSSDEGIFAKIQAMAGSTSRADMQNLMRTKGAVSKETWGEIASATLQRMGRDADGNFSPDRFLTAYGKLSGNGKKALFGGDERLFQSLDDIAAVSRRFKALNQYANPSGTAQNVIGPALGFSIISEPMTTLSAVAGSRVVSSLLSKPLSAKKIAAWAKAYEQAATKPGVSSEALLTSKAKALAAEASAIGGPEVGRQIFAVISRISGAPAEPWNSDNGRNEYKGNRQSDQPRVLLPDET